MNQNINFNYFTTMCQEYFAVGKLIFSAGKGTLTQVRDFAKIF